MYFLLNNLIPNSFNTQPPEGGWAKRQQTPHAQKSFNTQPPEGGWADARDFCQKRKVSTHSRPKAAGIQRQDLPKFAVFQHTAARRRLALAIFSVSIMRVFQHTAARRRLAGIKSKPP